MSALLLDALTKIRDSTFRDAATLRAYADKALNEYRAGDYSEAVRDEDGRPIDSRDVGSQYAGDPPA